MSDERDELESLVTIGGGHAKFTAGRILAAGYRKPRQVTTVEELDALPDKAIILDDMAGPLVRDGIWWRGASVALRISQVIRPATVLHVGGAE